MNIQPIQTNQAFSGKPAVIGNWKMNKTVREVPKFMFNITDGLKGVSDVFKKGNADVGVATPSMLFPWAKFAEKNPIIKVGGQNFHMPVNSGAMTGEHSIDMFMDPKADFMVIGHSERRQFFGETDEQVNQKIHLALEKGINPIVCVGETLEQREAGQTDKVVLNQLMSAYKNVSPEDAKKITVAYEPVWAIGTGKVCQPDEAQRVCKLSRDQVGGLYTRETGKDTTILYGGSVKPDNADNLFTKGDIDGGLVGGAALEENSFVSIVKSLLRQKFGIDC